jgi:DNA mismatch endonuclease, patch repair protein
MTASKKKSPQRRDRMTPKQRSYCMSRVKSKNTSLEMLLATELKKRKLKFQCHAGDLPGKPDFVFKRAKVIVFVDGDFWHGWHFEKWKHKLSPYWLDKISGNRRRDQAHFRKLRRMGWKVLRVWEHGWCNKKNHVTFRTKKIERPPKLLCRRAITYILSPSFKIRKFL